MKRIFAIFGLFLILAIAFALVKFRRIPSSDHKFTQVETSNLASLVKARASDAPSPNVVILLADDLGWADVGYRGSDIHTPNIDRLAREGMRLERFYVTPFCSPTRAALMTGRDPIKLGVAHAVLMAWDNGGVSPQEHFMSESFQAAGYDTAIIGKWHLGHTIEPHTPNARGFEHFYGHFNTDVNYFDHSFAGGYDFQENGVSVDHAGEYATDVHGDQAARYINELRDRNKPFFLYVPFLAPHSPMQAKAEDMVRYGHRIDTPLSMQKTYAAMVDSLDQAIGRILHALDEQGLTEDTLVLFFSDNGGFYNFGASNKPLRGGKLEAFEGGIRVNALMRWPAVLPPDSVNEAVISVQDMLPTLTRAAGIKAAHLKAIDGRDRWGAIIGQAASERKAPLFFTSNIPIYNKFQYGVLDGPWKLVQTVDHQRRSTSVQTLLFNVVEDPNETRDLALEHPAQVIRLTDLLDARLAEHPVGGTYVKIQPHPGWRAPKDYAEVVLPADKVNAHMWRGFGKLPAKVLQKNYGDKGRVIYE